MVGGALALAPAEGGVMTRLVAAAVMLVAAVFLVLLARDAWHWQRAVEDADARARLVGVGPDAWSADTALPSGVTERLLGLEDDLRFRRIATRALHAASSTPTSGSPKQRALLETALARLVRRDPDKARASRAADLLGVLLYRDPPPPDDAPNAYLDPSQTGPSSQQTPEQKATAQFETAVRLDPLNANAQANLELMLRQPQPPSQQGTPQAGAGERFGNKGSGARPPGRGF
jgi:hypothetical protein